MLLRENRVNRSKEKPIAAEDYVGWDTIHASGRRSRTKQCGEATENVFGMWTNERNRAVLFRRKLCNGAGKRFYCADCLNFIAKGE